MQVFNLNGKMRRYIMKPLAVLESNQPQALIQLVQESEVKFLTPFEQALRAAFDAEYYETAKELVKLADNDSSLHLLLKLERRGQESAVTQSMISLLENRVIETMPTCRPKSLGVCPT
jgi:hypothetical protein